MNKDQIDHSFLKAKITLRMNHLPEKEAFRVLDAFSGEGLIWDQIIEKTGRSIEVLKIDIKRGIKDVYLVGDNRKFITSIPLELFDAIDLDAYGLGFDLIDYILNYDLKNNVHHKLFITFAHVVYSQIPYNMLKKIGYTNAMMNKIRTLFCKNPFDKFKDYLGTVGIKKISVKHHKDGGGGKHYVFIQT